METTRSERAVRVTLVLLGVITATPVVALAAPGTLESAYGAAAPADAVHLALLQHRGVLQAALGAALIWAAFHPAARIPAALTAVATKTAFLVLMTLAAGTPFTALGAGFDLVAIAALTAIALHHARRPAPSRGDAPPPTPRPTG
ncbi:hypothetical protein [Bailinhaonella thermotolerans]|uniref:DUF4267 domain-containing protein n=1 Tax=Bailinhaonella thermotolerans TaxID=1070861 RepID=A0A3A4B9C3_9ACTN|nr:hypothetical protein [Bailinhaonella thermotolerans]RJL35479.1 hypothetical protein D5H75_01325 [Bailinhaonella thermotolerans]